MLFDRLVSFDLLKRLEKVLLKIHVVVNKAEERQICISEVLDFIPSRCCSLSPTQSMGSKIRAISCRSGDISVLGLKKVAVTICALETPISDGRDVTTMLRNDTMGIFIIGMGGVGKIRWTNFILN